MVLKSAGKNVVMNLGAAIPIPCKVPFDIKKVAVDIGKTVLKDVTTNLV
jgi:hypothetical protein